MLHENKTFNELNASIQARRINLTGRGFPAQEKSSECKYKQPGYKYVCDASGGANPRSIVQGTNASKVNYTVHDYGNPRDGHVRSGMLRNSRLESQSSSFLDSLCQGNALLPAETLKLAGTDRRVRPHFAHRPRT